VDRYDPLPDAPSPEFGVRALRPGVPASFGYLGVLALPLAALGLAYGRRRVRVPLFVMLVLATTVLALAGHSLLFSLLLALPSPLRSMNHYGDLLYRGGGFLLLLFAAGLGLEAAERRRLALRRLPLLFVAASVATSLVWLRAGAPPQSLVGFGVALMAGYVVVLAWAQAGLRASRARAFVWGLLGLALIDVSTLALWHVRLVMFEAPEAGGAAASESPEQDLDSKTQRPVLMRDVKQLRSLPLHQLPAVAAFCRAHAHAELPTQADLARAVEGPKGARSLALPAQLAADPALRPFFDAPADAPCAARLEVLSDYNSQRVSVTAAQPSLVFFRDADSRHWHATIGGAPASIHRAFGAFKAVAVPAGRSELRLRFAPPRVGMALIAAYSALGLLAANVLRRRPELEPTAQPEQQ
jgi:hypothetical protein